MRRKRVYIYAWLAGNLGDDLFVRILCEKYPNTRFYILADEQYKKKYHNITNLVVFSWKENKVRKVEKMLKPFGIDNGFHWMLVRFCDAVIHIGGSVYTQHNDDWTDFYNADAFLAKKSRRLYQISGNFGPYTDKNFIELIMNCLKNIMGFALGIVILIICLKIFQQFRGRLMLFFNMKPKI